MNRRQRDRLHRPTVARGPQAAEFPALPTALEATGPAPDRHPTGTPPAGDHPPSRRRRRRWQPDAATAAPGEPPAGRPEPPASPEQAAASPPAAPPAGHGEPATAAPAGQPAPDAMDDREAALEADYRGLLAMRPAGGWSAIERRQVRALAERMAELAAINRQIEDEGLTVPGRGGRPVAHPLISVRKATELAIKRARTDLGLNISVGESRRQGRAQAAAGDEYGRRPDGSWSPLLAYALDRDELLARPESHDYAPEQALYERLCHAGEIEVDGTPKRGGVLWLDQVKAGMNVATGET
jgi:hypothetical protein